MKTYIKIVLLAVMLGGIVAIEFLRMPMKVQAISYSPTPTPSVTPTIIPTSTPTPTYDLTHVVAKYNVQGLQREYADYIWNKWAPHGNYAQAVALCTNISEGHLDDTAYNENTDGSSDQGCWQYNSVHNLPDDITKNCIKATDYTYKIWQRRVSLGVPDGFKGMWYGYGSRNFQLCMETL